MQKKLYKSNKNKVFTGTCGGIGEYLNIDPTIIRLIFVIVLFFGGTGILVYIVAALIIPNTPVDDFENFDNMAQLNKDYQKHSKSNKKFTSDDEEFDSYFSKK